MTESKIQQHSNHQIKPEKNYPQSLKIRPKRILSPNGSTSSYLTPAKILLFLSFHTTQKIASQNISLAIYPSFFVFPLEKLHLSPNNIAQEAGVSIQLGVFKQSSPQGQRNGAMEQQVGLSHARRLAQGKVIRIHASSPFPVQIDGEPFIQQPGCLEITHHGQMFMLRRASEEPRGHAAAIMAEVLLDAECKGIINASQKKILLQQMALQLN